MACSPRTICARNVPLSTEYPACLINEWYELTSSMAVICFDVSFGRVGAEVVVAICLLATPIPPDTTLLLSCASDNASYTCPANPNPNPIPNVIPTIRNIKCHTLTTNDATPTVVEFHIIYPMNPKELLLLLLFWFSCCCIN